jgi:SMI1-KNR4 cell-wall
MWWLPIDGAIGQLALLRDIGDWPEELLPIAADGGGNLIVVDVATGRVSAWDHEDWSTTALADDFGAWMTHLADDMDANLVVAGSIDDDEEDAIMLLDAPPSPAAAPHIAPDRAARVLLACLLERRLVAVAGEDVEGLIAQLHGALATKSPAQRRRRVIAVLEESASIDEIFATDDVLGVLVDELG